MTKLKEARKLAGLTQKELSEKSGVRLRTIQALEQGYRELENCRGGIISRLREALKNDTD